jgi:hypothetical protein
VDDATFDRLARTLSAGVERPLARRPAVRIIAGGLLGAVLAGLGLGGVEAACAGPGRRCGDGKKCCPGSVCKGGKCRCKGGQAPCAGRCCQASSCGRCRRGEVCHAGACLGTGCPTGTRRCNGECIPTDACCGGCGGGKVCERGECRCPVGRTECAGRCCAEFEGCRNGVCTPERCDDSGIVKYCGPHPYNCCPHDFQCCPVTPELLNVCCLPPLVCCAKGCCDPD